MLPCRPALALSSLLSVTMADAQRDFVLSHPALHPDHGIATVKTVVRAAINVDMRASRPVTCR